MDLKEDIKQKVDIVTLIGRYVEVKKAGTNYKANCPFHNENSPSFVISPEMQFFKCFGCGKSGDIFTFLMEMEGIEFRDALKQLAEEAQIDMSKYQTNFTQKENRNHIYYELNELAKNFYTYTLLNLPVAKVARDYLKNRGLKENQIKEVGLGYAPNSWNSLHNFLTKKNFSEKDLETAGLIKRGNKGYYDVYRGRVMFPLENQGGKVVGFAGRTIINEDPKYINTKDTPVFNKSQFIFNLNRAKTEIRRKNEVIVTEGEFDAITPYLKGIKNVVALKGTAFTADQAKLLKRYAETAIIFFDSDSAGDNATARGIEIAQNIGLNLKIARLTNKFKDPDEAAKESIDIIYKAVDNAVPAYDFFFSYITSKYDVGEAYGKKKIIEFLKPKIQNIKDPILAEHYTKKLSEILDISQESIFKTNVETKATYERKAEINQEDTPQEIDPLFLYLIRAEKEIFKKTYKIVKKRKLLPEKYRISLDEYEKEYITKKVQKREYLDNTKNGLIKEDIFLKETPGNFEESVESQEAILNNLVKKYSINVLRDKINVVAHEISKAESLNDKEKLDKLQKKIKILTKQLAKLNA